ncbi:MAG: hypothetical protein ACE5J3_09735 [Methanosarcinales archaeon]
MNREKIVTFLLFAYGFALVATFALFFFKGFNFISLGESEMKWIGGAIIGELAGLFALVIKSVFPK